MTAPILIHSFPNDVHAAAVGWALRQLGAEVFFWPSGAFPAVQGLTTEISSAGDVRQSVRVQDTRTDLPRCKTVWHRRRKPAFLSRSLSPKDIDFVERECRAHLNSTPRLLSPDAFWVNPPRAAEQDIYKPIQLRTAATVGFSIPDTLFSNDPGEIRGFYDRHGGDIIYKAYRGATWAGEEGLGDKIAMGFTTTLRRDDLANDAALAAAPGIFQRKLAKDHEVRVTVMGRTLTAAKILSQGDEATQADWRLGYQNLRIAPIALPADIAAKCRDYMERARLNFGCFDFVVDPNGHYHFLEINQMGQFLWKEILRPDLPLLQMFCDFLIAADPQFEWHERDPRVTFKGYLESEEGRAFDDRIRNRRPAPSAAALS